MSYENSILEVKAAILVFFTVYLNILSLELKSDIAWFLGCLGSLSLFVFYSIRIILLLNKKKNKNVGEVK